MDTFLITPNIWKYVMISPYTQQRKGETNQSLLTPQPGKFSQRILPAFSTI